MSENHSNKKSLSDLPCWRILAVLYSIVLFTLNFIRIFDDNFWVDEAFTANLVPHSIPEIISLTAADVHPPLYYLFVKVFYSIFGDQGWAFHIVSLIPCLILIIFALTTIWDRFGKSVSVIFITILCLSDNALCYNVEVRMYSWGALFVLFTFYYFYRILNGNHTKDYVLFVIFSLLSAYTHYYCLVSVAFFYLALIILMFFKKKTNVKKVIISSIVTVAAYLPWFFIMLNSMLERKDNYWIEGIPTVKESIMYLFSYRFPIWLWLILACAFILCLLYETNILTVEKSEDKHIQVSFHLKNFQISDTLIWIVAGSLSILGTICFGIGISRLIRPFYITRYLYPVSIISWLLLGIIFSRLKGKDIYAVLLVICMLIFFIPSYINIYNTEKTENTNLTATLAATVEMNTDDIILTDVKHIDNAISDYYYPNVTHELIVPEAMPVLEQDTVYWLFINNKETLSVIFAQLDQQNFQYEEIISDGNLGTHAVCVYKLQSVH